ncbi:MAG: NAD-dependent epimerase/dehydratase family protein [Candidatus Omnitrophica bacterium]|nr:NAD-dependent epimerase/dehydratase family protein [Candidatus Omnitrophota bacterium]
MNYQTLLVTGGAGFVGSNLAVYLKKKYPALRVIVLDNLKRRGSELTLTRLKESGVEFMHGDIRCPEDLAHDIRDGLLIECSAEPSVLAGYGDNPMYVLKTNLVGTLNCLELARKNHLDLIFLSTSRVYPYETLNLIKTVEKETRFEWMPGQAVSGWSEEGVNESFSLDGPKSLYGATKLASEVILQEYLAAYGIKGVVNRCGVIAGPWQFGKVDQGVFSLWMLAHYFKKPLSYIGFGGKGKQVRDLLHIDDLSTLIDLQIANLPAISGKVYNVGGGKDISLSLLETTQICQEITGNRIEISSEIQTRQGDVSIYLTDYRKVYSDIGWQPQKTPQEALLDTYNWIRSCEGQLKTALT